MATVKEILGVAGYSYPSTVCGGNWVDLKHPVRVWDGKSKMRVICLLDPIAGKAILVGGEEIVSINDLVISKAQGRAKGPDITEEAMDVLQWLLNKVADERTQGSGGSQIQTQNAVAARILLSVFCMPREKGLSPHLDAIRKLRV